MNQNGMSALTIRSIAKHLGKSTAPIYTQYEGFDAIMDDLRLFVKDKILTYTSGSYTGDAFLDIGVGLIVFALENKNVYTHFFLTDEAYMKDSQQLKETYLVQMKRTPPCYIYLTMLPLKKF